MFLRQGQEADDASDTGRALVLMNVIANDADAGACGRGPRQGGQRRAGRATGPVGVVDVMVASRRAGMLAQEGPGLRRQQADLPRIPLDLDLASNPAGRRTVVGRLDFHTAVQMHRPDAVAVVAKKVSRGNAPKCGCSSANITATWRFVVPWMRVSAQRVSHRSRYVCAASSVSKRSPFKGVFWAWPTPASTLPLQSGSLAARHRQGDHAVMGEDIAVERIERRVVDVRGRRTPSRRLSSTTTRTVPPSRRNAASCSSARPLRAGAPRQQPHRLARVAERQDEESRPTIFPVAGSRAIGPSP